MQGPSRKLGIYLPNTARQFPESRGPQFPKMNFISVAAWPYESEGMSGWVNACFVNRRLMGASFCPDDGDKAFKAVKPQPIPPPAPKIAGSDYLLMSGLHADDFDRNWDEYRLRVMQRHGLQLNQVQWLEDSTVPDGVLLSEYGGGEFWYEDPDASAALTLENWRRRWGPRVVSRVNLVP